jgi:hypothetical protein
VDATRPPAVARLLGTYLLGDWAEAPLVRTPSHHVQLARPLDPLWQLRRLPDPYVIVARDEGVSCQPIMGEKRN